MKAKKVVKKLSKVATILSDVIQLYPTIEQPEREMLVSAKVSVGRTRENINLQSAQGNKKKSGKAQGSHLTATGRKKISIAAKKRWAVAKRKGIHAATGQPLSKTG